MKTKSFLALTLILILSFSCKEPEQGKAAIRPVKYEIVERAGGKQLRKFSGTTKSSSETNLSFRSGGLLMYLNAQVGKKVRKGTLLGRLDQTDVQLAYEQAEVDVQNAKAQYDAALSAYERVKQLYETNNASLSDYESAKTSYSSAQSAYEISLKRLDLQKSKVNYTELVAPMNGIISNVQAETNEVIQAGRTIITMSSENQGDFEVLLGLPERYINQIQNGDSVKVWIASMDGHLDGFVSEIGFASSGNGLSYPVTIELDVENQSKLRPDMPAEVEFRFGSESDNSFVIAPLKAVASGVDGNYVFKLISTDSADIYQVSKVPVELGPINKNGYIIRDGIEEGTLVAVAGLSSLYEGQKVKLLKD